MKKLVKTAKQQFEERLSELKVLCDDSYGSNHYYLCEEKDGRCIILYDALDNDLYEEIVFDSPLLGVYTDANFLNSLVEHWMQYSDEPIKRLFDWYSTADKDNPPFSIGVIAECASNGSVTSYSDLYEEVSDVRIITAGEQWELDAKKSTIHESEGDIPFKVAIDDTSLRFYYYEFGFYCDIYPSLESLRKDDIFIKDVTDRLLEFANYEGVGRLQDWIRVGGDFPLSFGWIFYSEYPRADVIAYEDKELPQEQTTEKKDFLDRFSSLKSDIIANIGELCENGASIDTEALFESYSIVWIDGAVSYFEDVADFSLMKTVEGHWKYGIEYGHDKGKTYDGRLELLTLESLLHILDSLH